MKKITTPLKPDEKNNIFTEGINYFETDKTSIWGKGDKATIQLLKKTEIRGKWLNLASGDGRYNLNLLKKVDFVIASDIDRSALSKLWHTTPENYRNKLDTNVFDITQRFPFENNTFDGVFCSGTLHLFTKPVLKHVLREIDRVLIPEGRIIIDFATDMKRTSPEGNSVIFGEEPLYSLKDAISTLKDYLKRYSIQLHVSEFTENFKKANPSYLLTCKFIVVIGKKVPILPQAAVK